MKPKKSATKSEKEKTPASHSSKPSKNYKIYPTKTFLSEAKDLLKKYPNIKEDFLALKDQLKKNPFMGESLGGGLYKIRMDISDKGKGKSGGARVITYVLIEDEAIIVLRTYDKGDLDTIITENLKKQVRKGKI